VEVLAEGLDFHMEHQHEVFPELVLDLPWDAPVKETLQTELTISDGTTVASPPPATRGGPS